MEIVGYNTMRFPWGQEVVLAIHADGSEAVVSVTDIPLPAAEPEAGE